jgi:hypothetical protein
MLIVIRAASGEEKLAIIEINDIKEERPGPFKKAWSC